MKRILYIGNCNSQHDVNWIKHFSVQTEEFECYLLCELSEYIAEDKRLELLLLHIQLTEQIHPFSISKPWKTIHSILTFRKIIKELKPDYIHVLFATPHSIWTLFTAQKSIITCRGSDVLIVLPNLLKNKGMKGIYFNLLHKLFEKAFLKASNITGTSTKQLKQLQHSFPNLSSKKLSLIRTGIEIEKLRKYSSAVQEKQPRKKTILSPRYIGEVYNTQYQIDAISQLPKHIIDAYEFIFIQKKNTSNYSNNQLKRLYELNHQVGLSFICLTDLNQDELWHHIIEASLVLNTPKSDGTPNTVLEALFFETPVILSDINYDTELFPSFIPRCKLSDPKTLTEAICSILDKKTSYDLKSAAQNVEKFGNRAIEMAKLKELYR